MGDKATIGDVVQYLERAASCVHELAIVALQNEEREGEYLHLREDLRKALNLAKLLQEWPHEAYIENVRAEQEAVRR